MLDPKRSLPVIFVIVLILSVASALVFTNTGRSQVRNAKVGVVGANVEIVCREVTGWYDGKTKEVFLEMDISCRSKSERIVVAPYYPLNYSLEVLEGDFEVAAVVFLTRPLATLGQERIIAIDEHVFQYSVAVSNPAYINRIAAKTPSSLGSDAWLRLKARFEDGTNSSNYVVVGCYLQKR
ncbi:MAG: hypothetical protein ACO1QS_16980 [Verrucomicrobiota bacterium]